MTIIFDSPRQTVSIIPYLVPDLYISATVHRNRLPTVLISLVYHLVATYPSQRAFSQHFDMIPSSFMPKNSGARKWISSLSSCLRSRNYFKFEELTHRSTILRLFEDTTTAEPVILLASLSISARESQTLVQRALFSLVDSLRKKARETAWDVIRSAYRELSCHADCQGTRDWLTRSLCLQSIVHDGHDLTMDQWLEQQSSLGRVRRKEGVEGGWIVCKVR